MNCCFWKCHWSVGMCQTTHYADNQFREVCTVRYNALSQPRIHVKQVYEAFCLKIEQLWQHNHSQWLITCTLFSTLDTTIAHTITPCDCGCGATRGVTVSTSAFLACHQCYCAGSSLAWGLNLRALVCGIFCSSSPGVFSGYSGFLPSFIGLMI